jgi:hypothetical protein
MAHFMKALGPGVNIQGNDKILILLKRIYCSPTMENHAVKEYEKRT